MFFFWLIDTMDRFSEVINNKEKNKRTEGK